MDPSWSQNVSLACLTPSSICFIFSYQARSTLCHFGTNLNFKHLNSENSSPIWLVNIGTLYNGLLKLSLHSLYAMQGCFVYKTNKQGFDLCSSDTCIMLAFNSSFSTSISSSTQSTIPLQCGRPSKPRGLGMTKLYEEMKGLSEWLHRNEARKLIPMATVAFKSSTIPMIRINSFGTRIINFIHQNRASISIINHKNIHESHLYGNIMNDSSSLIFMTLYGRWKSLIPS